MKNLKTTNSFILGCTYAIIMPAFLVGVIFLFHLQNIGVGIFSNSKAPFMLTLIPNLVLLRFLMLSFKLDRAGMGVLLITFIEFIAIFKFA